MKKFLAVILVLGSMSAFAATKEKVSIVINADTKELCLLTSNSVFEGNVESDLNQAGAYIKEISACNKGLDGKFRKVVKFKKRGI